MNDLLMWTTLLVTVVVSVGAALWSLWPVLQPGRAQLVMDDDRLTSLVERKDSALSAIKDLEFDYRVGKMSEADFQRVNERLRRQAISLMEQLDKIAPESASLDAALEAEIAKLRKTTDKPSKSEPVKPISAPVAAAPAPANSHAAVRFCTNCGHKLEPAHKFCANCGTPVAPQPVPDGETA